MVMCLNQCDYPGKNGEPCRCEMDQRRLEEAAKQKANKMNRQAIKKFLQDIPEKHLDELTEAFFYVSQNFPLSHPLQAAILNANKTTRQRIEDEIQAKKDKGEIA